MGNAVAIKNLKIGIMKDLYANGLISQKQMERLILRLEEAKKFDKIPKNS